MPAILAMLLAAAASPTAPKLASGRFAGVGIEPARAQFFAEYFADQLNAIGAVRVVTVAEMAALLGAERERQLLGCGGESNCLAELVGALDAAGVIIGSVAKIGDELAVQVKVVSPGGLLGLYSARVSSESKVLDFLAESARDLSEKLRPPAPKGRTLPWAIPVAVGAALLAGAVVCFVAAGLTFSRFNAGTPRYDNYDALVAARSGAELQNIVGLVLLGVGFAAVAGGAIFGITGVFD